MVKVDLITGFLGSGKTTFIREYAKYLIHEGKRIGIIENDYGAVNVDMMLFQDIVGEMCDIEMIAGGCDLDCHKRRFKTKLIAMGMLGYDRVIVEPSGIFDVEEFFDILAEEPLDRWFEVGSVITMLDPQCLGNMSEKTEYLMATQLACAGKIIIKASSERVKPSTVKGKSVGEQGVIQGKLVGESGDVQGKLAGDCSIKDSLNDLLAAYRVNRQLDDELIMTPLELFERSDFSACMECGYRKNTVEKMWFEASDIYSSLYYMDKKYKVSYLKEKISQVFNDEACGRVMRIKGFAIDNNQWYIINATAEQTEIYPAESGQDIVVVIGEALEQFYVDKYLQ